MKRISEKEVTERLEGKNLELISIEQHICENGRRYRKALLKCLVCGDVFARQLNAIKSYKGCAKCEVKKTGFKKRLGIDIAKDIFKKEGFELLDEEYTNSWDKMTGINKEGFRVYTSVNNLKTCQGKVSFFDYRNPYCLENISLWITQNKKPFKILTEKISNVKEKLKVECLECGNIWNVTRGSFLSGRGCNICGIKARGEKQRFTYDKIVKRLREINENIEILDSDYKDSKTPIKCKCRIDGHIWYPIWNSLAQGCGCPECALRNRRGERAYQWKGGISNLTNVLRAKLSQWKLEVLKECDFKCDITGRKDNKEVHHLYGFNNILEKVFYELKIEKCEKVFDYTEEEINIIVKKFLEIHNKYGIGVCLCREEHELFHKIYGKGDNYPEQYYKFKKDRLSGMS